MRFLNDGDKNIIFEEFSGIFEGLVDCIVCFGFREKVGKLLLELNVCLFFLCILFGLFLFNFVGYVLGSFKELFVL